jgi:hypothetical protein
VPTNQKQRLYDEIAASTFNDPRFIELNKRLHLTEKDLRKAAKSQNMVECAMYKYREFRGTPTRKILSQAYPGMDLKVQRLEYTIQNGL